MISLSIGLGMMVVSLAMLMRLKPRGGQVSQWATMPFFEWAIPTLITAGIAMGAGFVVAGLVS